MVDKQKSKADLKVVILGDGEVGKTTFISRYIHGSFSQDITKTLGAAFTLKRVGNYNVAIWDTAGQERYAGLSSFYCRDAGAIIMAFDLKSQKSFESLRSRFLTLLATAPGGSLKVIIGTKLDSVDESNRQVTSDNGRRLAVELNGELLASKPETTIPYFETSSVDGTNVVEVFDYIFSHHFGDCSAQQPLSRGVLGSSPRRECDGSDKIVLTHSSVHNASKGSGPSAKSGCCR